MKDSVAADTTVQVAISGTAPPPPADSGASGAQNAPPASDSTQDPSVNSRAEEAPTTTATALPARLDSLKWIVVAGFASLFSLGLIYVWRRPELLPGNTMADAQAAAPVAQSPATAVSPSAPPSAPVSAATVAEVDNSVRNSLDGLKDSLFRLELRHQAGTISEEDYAREYARIQSHLRELVRG